jgi:replicative DNA helicase
MGSTMTEISVPTLIIQNLITNPDFTRQAIPYIQKEYFESKTDQAIFESINRYYESNGRAPSKNILMLSVTEDASIGDNDIVETQSLIKSLYDTDPEQDISWLLSHSEAWCQERAMYLAILKSISIYDGTNKELSPHAIPNLVESALSVSFKTSLGQDWVDDAESRFEHYSDVETKIAFDMETLNDITLGGVTRKTLSLILGGIHVGKTMTLCHLTAGFARMGYNVLYLSMEMGEYEIMQRVDCNMMKTPMDQIANLGKDAYMKRIHYLRSKNYGKIKVIQYPTSMGHAGHFKAAINELKIKTGFVPDVVMVDYVGIVASSRIKIGQTNSHFYLKSVAEELRALAIELDFACFTAMQLTRGGMASTDVDMTDTAESIGIPGVCDLMLAIWRTDEMDQLKQLCCKQLKNRFRQMQYRPRFVIGCEFDQQLLYDVNNSEQTLYQTSGVSYDSSAIKDKFEKNASRKRNVDIDYGEYQ